MDMEGLEPSEKGLAFWFLPYSLKYGLSHIYLTICFILNDLWAILNIS